MEVLKVTIRNKTEVFLRTECHSVSMVNEIGPFDILPEHANFIAIIQGDVQAHKVSGPKWRSRCVRGIVRVVSNTVDVVILE